MSPTEDQKKISKKNKRSKEAKLNSNNKQATFYYYQDRNRSLCSEKHQSLEMLQLQLT